ncbi:MAG: SDR family oxidoreductase [Simkaniaceae bacterium]|nr:MAG: SDR family oxidoreductase [Simkaniaceae bacterium]
MTKFFRWEFEDFNKKTPTLTETPLTARLLDSESKKRGQKKHPMKRVGTADDIAETIAFLLSAKSSWITRQVIGVDGGISTL